MFLVHARYTCSFMLLCMHMLISVSRLYVGSVVEVKSNKHMQKFRA